jgi:hypothetical protein
MNNLVSKVSSLAADVQDPAVIARCDHEQYECKKSVLKLAVEDEVSGVDYGLVL